MASNNNGYTLPANLDADREELTYPRQTEHDHYTADTIADPEGTEQRERRREQWPSFVLENYYEDTKSLWGKPNKNDESLLRPTAAHIMECMSQSEISDADNIAMTKLANTQSDLFDTLFGNYSSMLDAVDGSTSFEIMKTVANITTNNLAKRAIAKATYFGATGRLTESYEEIPEYVERMQDRMFEASTQAAVWKQVHAALWSHLQWKKSPIYYVENAIKNELAQKARYFDKTYRPVKPATATCDDLSKFNIAC